MLDICHLMSAYDPDFFTHNYKMKYVRHKDSRKEYKDITQNYFEEKPLLAYQENQANTVFKDTDYIISFIGLDGTKALFWSVLK